MSEARLSFRFSWPVLFGVLWMGAYALYPTYLGIAPDQTTFFALVLGFLLVNLILLTVWLRYRGVDWCRISLPRYRPDRYDAIVSGFLFLFLGISFDELAAPLPYADNPNHATIHPVFYDRLVEFGVLDVPWALRLAFVLLGAITVWYALHRIYAASPGAFLFLMGIVGIFAVYLSDVFAAGRFGLIRFPPLEGTLYVLVTATFGYQEVAIRGVQAVFTLGTGFVLYAGIRGLRGTAFTAATTTGIYLFAPVVLEFGNMVVLEPTQTFFVLASILAFLCYVDSNWDDLRWLLAAVWLASTGFLVKRTTLLLFIILGLCVGIATIRYLWDSRRSHPGDDRSPREFLASVSQSPHNTAVAALYVGMIPVFPWLEISSRWVWRQYEFTPSNWTGPKATTYLVSMPEYMTLLVAIAFLAGIVCVVARKREPLTLVSLAVIALWYVFYTSDAWAGVDRFILPFVPFVAIVTGIGLEYVRETFEVTGVGLSIGIVVFLLLAQFVLPASATMAGYAQYGAGDHRALAYDEAIAHADDITGPGEGVIVFTHTHGCCVPVTFYERKYRTDAQFIIYGRPSIDVPEMADLRDLLDSDNATTAIVTRWAGSADGGPSSRVVDAIAENRSGTIHVREFGRPGVEVYVARFADDGARN